MPKQKVSDRVFAYLRDSIQDGKWKPGDMIPSENLLAAELGISRISVRAAISRLSSLGILESRQGEGTFVCKSAAPEQFNRMIPMLMLDHPARMDMFEFRRILEVEAAGLAASRAGAEAVAQMRAATDGMVKATEVAEGARRDMEFHYLIAQASQNQIIVKVVEILMDYYMHSLEENVAVMGSEGASYHYQILSAIEMRDAARAKDYMLEHLNNTARRMAGLEP
ncbi:MAG: FadR/GntR family transcriptional regulator [Clostridia bacterium]|nr:FadR/GntR family transcriptional regulator [Clostridia bacterium]